jgi:hypothetical protein
MDNEIKTWLYDILSAIAAALFLISFVSCQTTTEEKPLNVSGIYPHLAYYNNEGECGTGAVAPWADRLWVITYGPHLPDGSSDKLYEITPDLKEMVREESLGGTPANRMIHRESNQLFIGPYAIDAEGGVRAIPYTAMSGRHTGNARHLTDPENKIYYATMEEGFYEVDVHTLQPVRLYEDNNPAPGEQGYNNSKPQLLPGVHGKGVYSGQGVLVYSNNGENSAEALKRPDVESGVLAEWNGKDWTVVRRNQFVEVTGPGGIYGNPHPATDPIWVTGWDHRSLLVGVRDNGSWSFYRLPKASHSYDGGHGWNTEWPRIRNVGADAAPDYLMTMHGMFWHFPERFSAAHSAGLRPRSAYLKVIGDFTRWNDGLVFGCDDSAQKEFLNTRKVKGSIEGPGQSNSNLWFTSLAAPDALGIPTANGAVWINDSVPGNMPSEPFLFSGWENRSVWIKNNGAYTVNFMFEVDQKGDNQWKDLKRILVAPGQSVNHTFAGVEKGEWVRVSTDKGARATVSFNYSNNEQRASTPDALFAGITPIEGAAPSTGGLLYSLGDNRRALGLLANQTVQGKTEPQGYYEINEKMEIVRKNDPQMEAFIAEKMVVPSQAVLLDKGSVLIVDDAGRRWRLPLGSEAFDSPTRNGEVRICREVATERDLFNCHGTFYELPAENADGFAKIRPIASHNLKINDYASYRGMLVLTGLTPDAKGNGHIFVSKDKKAAVWAGAIDDLWQLGKPVGHGGPWVDDEVTAHVASDPYLTGFYDKRMLTLQHNSDKAVTFTIEADPTGSGDWMEYTRIEVAAGEKKLFEFPRSFSARWLRFVASADVRVTAWLEYR